MSTSSSLSTCLAAEACFKCSVADAEYMVRSPCLQCFPHGAIYLCAPCLGEWRCGQCGQMAREGDSSRVPDFASLTSPSAAESTSDASSTWVGSRSGTESVPDADELRVDSLEHTERLLLYIAVPASAKDVILEEGYKTRRRNHVPAAGTEERALRAYHRHRQSSELPALLAVASLEDGNGCSYAVMPCDRAGSGHFRIAAPGLPRYCLTDTSSVLFVCVPRNLRDLILQEGYRPTRRSSVPAATSREDAVRAYRRSQCGPYEVLGALPPADLPRHRHRNGWKLRTTLFPSKFLRQLLA
eukprot:gnl/TRDRNA2_/TRDRNA2_199714_c0_seq1.p1 gnl/TRDRNA2_/TRDRNA2_199714_c0~~gnl/TRDRNA2_/TRDRNA2_199714_c0_seq1.p1  ORF type:complete len:299 (+),score=35.87 gnl/TRDRNA2_/TRDRNA2_199714_c0_seq1:64-960(+)